MKKTITIFLTIMLMLFINIDVKAESLKENLKQAEYAKDELIVIFDDNVSNTTINKIVESKEADCEDIIKTDDSKIAQVTISSDDEMIDAIKSFDSVPSVELVQPNYKYGFNSLDGDYSAKVAYQYYLDNINVKQAWSLIERETYSKTKVAVIDTGVDVHHKDLQKNLSSTSEYIATIGGELLSKEEDADIHGTHVSGIIGATNNDFGVTGVASGNNNDLVEILAVGSSPDGESLYTLDIIEAIKYAKENGAKVINMSFGGLGRDRAMEKAIKDAYDSGIVLVAAAGNDAIDYFSSPSDFKEVISVNASNKYNQATYWSDYGLYKDITAPGSNIISTLPFDKYGYESGTSMASPVISAVAALILNTNPNLTPAQVYNILCATTNETKFDNYKAYGIVNALKAVEAAQNFDENNEVEELTIKTDSVEVYENDDISLETLIRPATAFKNVTWTSSDDQIAIVDENGKVTGVKEGTATITGTIDDKEVKCNVRVLKSIKATSLTIKNKEAYKNMVKGQIDFLTAELLPEDATITDIYWTSSDRSILDVTQDGYITAKNIGTATITAKTYDGTLSDSVEIKVGYAPSKIEITNPASTMLVGENYTINAKILANNDSDITSYHNLIWSSTNSNVAKINKTTGEVTALSPGITYITVKTKPILGLDGQVSKLMRLAVGKQEYSPSDYGLKVISKTYNSATIKWTKFLVARSYIVERSTNLNGPYKVIKTINNNSTNYYKDTGLYLNKKYYYRVKAVYNDSKSFNYSYRVVAKPTLTTPSITLKNASNHSIKISWGKINGANGYTIYRSTSKNGPYKVVKRVTTTYYTDKNLVKNKRYYYKVAAYRVIDGKRIYSSYSLYKSKVVY